MEQLHWYALQAVHSWGFRVERLRLMPVWLSPDLTYDVVTVRSGELDDLTERIRLRQADLVERLGDAEGELSLEDWPICDDPHWCGTCVFRGSCEGALRVGAAPRSAPVSLAD